MKLAKKKYSYLIEDLFTPGLIAGFSTNELSGELPRDLHKAVSFLNNKFKVSYLKQIHSSIVVFSARQGEYEGDGLFTQEHNLVLGIKTADCLPLFFESRELGVIGMVHMGWRSAAGGILANIDYDLASFKVVVGVALRKCCYEVDEEFLNQDILKDSLQPRGDKFYFDPVAFAKKQLCSRGLLENNFFDLGICNFCSGNELFSYRKTETLNRNISFILRT